MPCLTAPPIVNIVCVPGLTTDTASGRTAIDSLQGFCADARAFCVVDSPQNANVANTNTAITNAGQNLQNSAASGAANSAMYFPWVHAPDPLAGSRPALIPPCGFVAGIYADTDASRGVWKAPAGIDASLTGDRRSSIHVLTDPQNGGLNPQASTACASSKSTATSCGARARCVGCRQDRIAVEVRADPPPRALP